MPQVSFRTAAITACLLENPGGGRRVRGDQGRRGNERNHIHAKFGAHVLGAETLILGVLDPRMPAGLWEGGPVGNRRMFEGIRGM